MRSFPRLQTLTVLTLLAGTSACGPYIPCNDNTACAQDEVCIESICVGVHASRGAGEAEGSETESSSSSSASPDAGSNDSMGGSSSTPVMLDLHGSGRVELTSVVTSTVRFDLDADGVLDRVAWTLPQGARTDGFLAWDRNGNGRIDDGKELFGNQHGAANGFSELARLDDNHDGRIDAQDRVFTALQVWQDRNGDGNSEKDELDTLSAHGVRSVSLDYLESSAKDVHGNALKQQGTFSRTDGTTGVAVDAWLRMTSGNARVL
ncbi:MAG: hypothetical protein AB2A00_27975 [Myxococcota bacterium]